MTTPNDAAERPASCSGSIAVCREWLDWSLSQSRTYYAHGFWNAVLGLLAFLCAAASGWAVVLVVLCLLLCILSAAFFSIGATYSFEAGRARELLAWESDTVLTRRPQCRRGQ